MSSAPDDSTPTASQTAGPFLHLGFNALCNDVVIPPGEGKTGVEIHGRIIDGDGNPVSDAAMEIWAFRGADSSGFGRVYTDEEGRFRFTTVRPGRVNGPEDARQAPHLLIMLFMRGLLKHLTTRMYFPGDAHEDDPILARVPADRRWTLIARAHATTASVFEWDIVLQGECETVFFQW
jgi:protocatechuate 3,4-dioxygenase alpha subunit